MIGHSLLILASIWASAVGTFTVLQRVWPSEARRDRQMDKVMSLLFSIGGPISLLVVCVILCAFAMAGVRMLPLLSPWPGAKNDYGGPDGKAR